MIVRIGETRTVEVTGDWVRRKYSGVSYVPLAGGNAMERRRIKNTMVFSVTEQFDYRHKYGEILEVLDWYVVSGTLRYVKDLPKPPEPVKLPWWRRWFRKGGLPEAKVVSE